MKVVSPAGDFEITIENSSVEGDSIVLKGQMGVWDSKIYLKPGDLITFASMLIRPSIIMFLFKYPFKKYFFK
ncbi:MAG: hypothetical protein GTN99_09800 [Candidatus Dadabacteria bacterium]|nr:hypothetical protein [Gammaproteobacteria bacterium]NIT05482.1 hypothetical protein [Gammaproteobacteria bacterium]NIT14510.1 hypothetical protein [Candidatus Dadabacteria bacterium]